MFTLLKTYEFKIYGTFICFASKQAICHMLCGSLCLKWTVFPESALSYILGIQVLKEKIQSCLDDLL